MKKIIDEVYNAFKGYAGIVRSVNIGESTIDLLMNKLKKCHEVFFEYYACKKCHRMQVINCYDFYIDSVYKVIE